MKAPTGKSCIRHRLLLEDFTHTCSSSSTAPPQLGAPRAGDPEQRSGYTHSKMKNRWWYDELDMLRAMNSRLGTGSTGLRRK